MKIIKTAIWVSKFLIAFNIILLLALLFVSIHWHFNSFFYEKLIIVDGLKAGYGLNLKLDLGQFPTNDLITLNSLDKPMLYWMVLRQSLLILLTTFIIKSILKVLRSIESMNTFYHGNIKYFQHMAKYGLAIFIISSFNITYLGEQLDVHFTIPFGSLLFTLGSWVMAEVFRSGKELLEDKNMIV